MDTEQWAPSCAPVRHVPDCFLPRVSPLIFFISGLSSFFLSHIIYHSFYIIDLVSTSYQLASVLTVSILNHSTIRSFCFILQLIKTVCIHTLPRDRFQNNSFVIERHLVCYISSEYYVIHLTNVHSCFSTSFLASDRLLLTAYSTNHRTFG